MAIFSDSEITNILRDVSSTLADLAGEALHKAEGSSSASSMSKGSDSAGGPPGLAEGSASSSGSSGSAPPDAGDPSSPPAPPAEAAAASAPPPGAVPAGDPAASASPAGAPPPGADPSASGAPPADPMAGGDDMQGLVAEFAKMPPEHVAQILEAAKQVLLAQQPPGGAPAPSPMDPSSAPQGLAQAEVGDGGLDGGSPAGPMNQKQGESQAKGVSEPQANGGSPLHPAAESGNMHAKLASPSNLVPQTTLKGEDGGNVLSPPAESGATHVPDSSMLGTTANVPETALHGAARKSEVEEKFASLEKRMEQLIAITQDLVEKPIRKALTGFDVPFLAKPGIAATPAEQLSKAEITKRLNEKVRDPSLSKQDRENINAFYDRQVGVDKIAHLLGK